MSDSRLDVLVVAGEPCWPAVNGGRLRTGSLAEALALARDLRVAVAAPPDASELDSTGASPPVQTIDLAPREAPSLRHSLGLQPRLGRAVAGRATRADLADVIARTRPRVVLHAMSYIAAVCPRSASHHTVVDFANIEAARLGSLARSGTPRQRASCALEAAKARRWEPRVARAAALAVAVDEIDASRLARWGARPIVVPNTALRRTQSSPSAADAPVVLVASGTYRPNVESGEELVNRIWPLVRMRVPTARLRIVGHRSDTVFGWAHGRDGIEVVGSVESLDDVYADAALLVAPVSIGGGTQLKVLEGLAAGRVVVVTEYGARSVPRPLADAAVVAPSTSTFAEAISRLLQNPAERHRREAVAARGALPTWAEAAAPLVDALRELRAAA